MCMCVCVVNATCVKVASEPEEGTTFPRAEVTGGCELPAVGTRNNTSPLDEQQEPMTTEPSLQHLIPSLIHSQVLPFKRGGSLFFLVAGWLG